MKLYSIGETSQPYHEEQTWLAVWENDQDAAIRRFNDHWTGEGGDSLTPDDVAKLSIEDVTEKAFTEPPSEPGEERRPAVLRRIGRGIDGESSCDTCGLYAMDVDEFAVCPECCQCGECGCDCEDCPPTASRAVAVPDDRREGVK